MPSATSTAVPQTIPERGSGQVHRGVVVYRADCRDLQCLPAQGRSAPREPRPDRAALVLRGLPGAVRGYHATEAYQKAMRKRQVWVEPLFAEAKEWHGLRRFRLRGLKNVNIQGLLIAAGQNLKRFLAATGWGRRMPRVGASWPSGGARAALGRLWVITDPAGDRGTGELDPEWPVTATPATGGFFQRPGGMGDSICGR